MLSSLRLPATSAALEIAPDSWPLRDLDLLAALAAALLLLALELSSLMVRCLSKRIAR